MDNSTNRNCTTHFDYVENPPIEEARVVGIIYLFLCSFCIIPYLIVMSTIVSNKSLSKIHAYRIMVHLGVMDVGELFSFYLVITLMMITNSTFDYLFDKIANAVANGFFWTGQASMIFILAINRFIVLLDIRFPYWLNENLFYKIILILAYGWSLINFIVCVLPYMGAIMLPYGFIYEAGNSLFCVIDIAVEQNLYSIGLMVLTWALYLIIVVYLIIQRQLVSSDSRIIVEQEGKLLLQFMFVCTYKSVICAIWNYYPTSDATTYAVFISFALIDSGYAPYMYFFMNRTLRHYILKNLRGFFGINHATNVNMAAMHAW